MIVIRLWGGIGNQLFQYSFGEYLRLTTRQEIKYDISSFGKADKFRKFELDIINSNIPAVDNIKFSHYTGIPNRILRFLFCLKKSNRFILERDFSETLLSNIDSKGILYLQGYWQKDLYPSEVLRYNPDCFTPCLEKPLEVQNIEAEIKKEAQATALHVRRGDYYASKKNTKKYGVCNSDYYHRAISYLRQRQRHDKLFVFSDDLEWVEDNLDLPENTFLIPSYDINNFWFIYLMSQCKNIIISNSSFSWWGAYLSPNIDKAVIAPNQWIIGLNTAHVLPDWITL